ncbi:MAG: protein translocase subunit SecF [Bryobacteraceae bacterium]
MELFKNTNFDFLGRKWPFIIASLVLLAAGIGSLVLQGGPRQGIDFRGGVLMYVRFAEQPPADRIRSALAAEIPGEIVVQDIAGAPEVIVTTELQDERSLDDARRTIVSTLAATFDPQPGKLDFNNSGQGALADRLRDPLLRAGVALSEQELQSLVGRMLNYRDTPPRSGLIRSFDELRTVEGVTPQVVEVMNAELYPAPFAIRNVEMVGPKIGAELRMQAILATLYALGGMLVYIAFRFEWVYGVAAVVAVFHDTLITIGLFSLFDREISLTVVAALLTLVGYSMNDTIVIFDRIRENLKLRRREAYPSIVNASINQTLSRTVMTSGLTFLSVLALFLFGGPVLNNFAFALVVGILVGTYSSVFIASPILVFWYNLQESRKAAASVAAPTLARKGNPKAVR